MLLERAAKSIGALAASDGVAALRARTGFLLLSGILWLSLPAKLVLHLLRNNKLQPVRIGDMVVDITVMFIYRYRCFQAGYACSPGVGGEE